MILDAEPITTADGDTHRFLIRWRDRPLRMTLGYSRPNCGVWMPLYFTAIAWTTQRRCVHLSGGGLMACPLLHHFKTMLTMLMMIRLIGQYNSRT
ncbi:hypothetical protein KSP40_PGU005866 [Platanthera guangdongensis]|uniref:Uncharacterized protein n=1 Tax=Platanthera guangdongensis TaxID=2320717 RepID=A0ABR2LYI7_9ASPA